MDFLTFVTKVFDAWAWPVVVLSIVGWFRDDLKRLLPNLSSLKGAGIEAIFGKKIEEAVETAAEVEAETPPPPVDAPVENAATTDAAGSANVEIAKSDVGTTKARLHIRRRRLLTKPEFAIVESWKEIEQAVLEYVSATKGRPIAAAGPMSVNWLKQNGFSDAEAELFLQLKFLRTLLTDDKVSVSSSHAKEYLALADTLINTLKQKAASTHPRRVSNTDE